MDALAAGRPSPVAVDLGGRLGRPERPETLGVIDATIIRAHHCVNGLVDSVLHFPARQAWVREKAGGAASPSAAIIDSQSANTAQKDAMGRLRVRRIVPVPVEFGEAGIEE
jgi:hypothetical protein